MHPQRRFPFAPTAVGVLCASILAAALTTTELDWWQSCFSRLGATGDASSVFFNGGVIVTGAVIALSAMPLGARLRDPSATGFRIHPAVPMLVPALLVTLGISLILIGLLPLSVNQFAHERAANGAIASSAALLLVHRWQLRGLSRVFDGLVNGAIVVLTLGFASLVLGVISLTVFEAMAFGVILTWLHLLERCLTRGAPAAEHTTLRKLSAMILVPHLGDKAARC